MLDLLFLKLNICFNACGGRLTPNLPVRESAERPLLERATVKALPLQVMLSNVVHLPLLRDDLGHQRRQRGERYEPYASCDQGQE